MCAFLIVCPLIVVLQQLLRYRHKKPTNSFYAREVRGRPLNKGNPRIVLTFLSFFLLAPKLAIGELVFVLCAFERRRRWIGLMGRFTPYKLKPQSLGRLRVMGKDKCCRCGVSFVVGQTVVPSGTRTREPNQRNYYCKDCGKTVKKI